MVERPPHDIRSEQPDGDARSALERLLGSLHRHGFLRFANDVVSANARMAEVLVGALDKPGTQIGMQNLSVLVMALSSIPPEQFGKMVFAAADALRHIGEWEPSEHEHVAPGVRGFYRLLHDDALWDALTPLLEGMKVFAQGLAREPDQAVSALAAKPTRT
ncbi:DUF1641 domain-containing protein [Burkholderia dolosa]|jgi:uncharacterized protein YjgD (DUF1641 family)|uniref:DUF1641 domain-containing protein n=1 Tax=Burkholderia dolosa TaxID=152500 RepID=UPI001B9979A6|nr:DUF1641 domain-containing protein [Burkholderia dolosa]MBR8057610.1 DUF1641 domain-containing protein [Burkholderia dolosa]MBR8302891.1 DUF1641 domain-containing protein [Burkholderia dolosa]MBR8314719.1 DUF1641 domain-containing protein [Burkholderia dolosa]MBR8458895.1 DUF1641 domain-containing protein [Burkholderia dolosa]MBY4831156.1 DUF1641 domain-containing protein [Burkholderia dolosa]